jgi:hypothetical protein
MSASILWLIYSVLVMTMPGIMMSMYMSGDMVHIQLNTFSWHLSLFSVLTGILAWLAWFALAGVFAWTLASIYNRL